MTVSADFSPPRARLLARVFNAAPEEVPALMLSFGFFFCVLCGYYIQRPIRDESGVLLGRDFISWAFAVTFLVMLAAVPALGVEGLADYGWSVPKLPAKPEARAIPSPIKDFYLTNAICRASPTMQRCSDELLHGGDYAEAAE